MNTVEITTEEYRELVLKAYKYDKLRKDCVAGMYTTMKEDILFDITDAEMKEIEERRKGQ